MPSRKLKQKFRTVLRRFWNYRDWPKNAYKKWKERFPKRGIWPIGPDTLNKYYSDNLSMYGKKFSNEPTLMVLSNTNYKKANWNKQFFTKKEVREILADKNFRSFDKLLHDGYLTPVKLSDKRIIYFSSEEVQRELLIRELLVSMCDNIRVRDARLRQTMREKMTLTKRRYLKRKKEKAKNGEEEI